MSLEKKFWCALCRKPEDPGVPMRLCEACQIAKYCDLDCERLNRRRHSKVCSKVQAYRKELILFNRMSDRYKHSHRFEEINAIDELAEITLKETELTGSYLCAQKCLEYCEKSAEANLLEDTFYGSTMSDQMIFCTFHTYLNLGMSSEATGLYYQHLDGVSVYCDLGQTLLAWDKCLDKQKAYSAFEDIIYSDPDQESLMSRLGRNQPAMVRIRYYFFLNSPDFEVASDVCWLKLKELLWKIKEESLAHYPESLNLFLRRMHTKNRENFVAYFFEKLRALKEEKDNPEKQKKWKLKLEVEEESQLKEIFFQEVDIELTKFLTL